MSSLNASQFLPLEQRLELRRRLQPEIRPALLLRLGQRGAVGREALHVVAVVHKRC